MGPLDRDESRNIIVQEGHAGRIGTRSAGDGSVGCCCDSLDDHLDDGAFFAVTIIDESRLSRQHTPHRSFGGDPLSDPEIQVLFWKDAYDTGL